MIERKLRVDYISVNDIKEYENNAKEHPDWQIEQIANSIRAFGFNDPLALDEDNQIIEGHGRYLAAKRMAMKKVPCIYLKGLSEETEKELLEIEDSFDDEEERGSEGLVCPHCGHKAKKKEFLECDIDG